ncbi:hypothetical protein L1I79_28075 [Strepomyces sp. STD 3.1]|nr:hypothetical protein [Streptomyces sp. STD 3.1]
MHHALRRARARRAAEARARAATCTVVLVDPDDAPRPLTARSLTELRAGA